MFTCQFQLLLIDKKPVQVNETLSRASQLIEQWQGPAVQKESLKVFFLVLQVSHYLTAGQVLILEPVCEKINNLVSDQV